MRSFLRWILGAATILSLGCFLIVAGIWLRSEWGTDSCSLMNSSGKSGIGVDWSSGSVMLYSLWGNARRDEVKPGISWELGLPRRNFEAELRRAPNAHVTALGFGAASWGQTFFAEHFRARYEGQAAVIFPLWCALLLTGAPAALFGFGYFQRRSAARRYCANCGHRLEPSMRQCPWCGKVRASDSIQTA